MTVSYFSEQIIEACKVSDRIYAFNPKIRRANFYGQQLRALALVEAFHELDWIKPAQRDYLVVGAGVTGMTVAAALLTVGANVTLVERAKPLQEYMNAPHRELHPNIISWPFQEMRAITDLPFLNWHCQQASDVAKQLLREWRRTFADKVEYITADVASVDEVDDIVQVACTDGSKYRKDRVILATGFDTETPLGNNRTPGYWNLLPIAKQNEVTVSGAGDGALIDVVYQLYGIEAVAAARVMAYALRGQPLEEDIKEVEAEALALRDAGDREGSERRLANFYSKIGFPSHIAKRVTDLQTGTQNFGSRIVHRGVGPFDAYAAPANKALLALSMSNGSRRVRESMGETVQDADDSFHIVNGTAREKIDTADLVVRHGASHNLLKILSSVQVDALMSRTSPELTAIVPDSFNREIYERAPKKPIAPSRWHGTYGQFDLELEERLIDLIKYVDKSASSVQIERLRSGVKIDPNTATEWNVRAEFDSTSALPSVFPVKVSNVTVTLTSIRQTLPQF